MNYNIEFGGGLGDVIWQMYVRGKYSFLEHLNPEDRVRIDLVCHNPYASELFKWHPKCAQIDTYWNGYWGPSEHPAKKLLYGIPDRENYPSNNPADPINIYASPDDFAIINQFVSKSYIVVSASAGDPSRNIPVSILDSIVNLIPIPLVFVGRNYRGGRIEVLPSDTSKIINLIDKLSAPGTLELVKRSKGIISAHSALILYTWCIRHPNFLLYPRIIGETQIKLKGQCAFGRDYPETIHGSF